MAAFTPERRTAANRALIPPSGDRRRAAWRYDHQGEMNRDPITGAPGGLAGKGVAEKIDPTAEEAYWRTQYTREPYYERGYTFDDYYPGYRTGWEGRSRYTGRTYEQVERDLQRDYQRNRGNSQLEWSKNRHAVRAAWERFDRTDDFEHGQ